MRTATEIAQKILNEAVSMPEATRDLKITVTENGVEMNDEYEQLKEKMKDAEYREALLYFITNRLSDEEILSITLSVSRKVNNLGSSCSISAEEIMSLSEAEMHALTLYNHLNNNPGLGSRIQ